MIQLKSKYEMMMKISTILIGIFCIFLLSCTQENKEYNEPGLLEGDKQMDSLDLSETTIYTFQLDTVTASTSPSIHYIENNSGKWLSKLNINNSSIDFFDYTTGNLGKRIYIYKEGPNGLGNVEFLAHHVITLDSILILNPWTSTFFIINSEGKVIFKKQENNDITDNNSIGEQPMAGSLQPLYFFSNKIFSICGKLGLSLNDHTKMKCVLVHDIKKNSTQKILPRPEVYNKGNWGANCMMDFCYVTFNDNTKTFIYSFPIDPYVYETDHNLLFKKHLAPSRFFKEVSPMSLSRLDVQNHKKSVEYDYTTSHYFNIIYDKYKNLYYRFTLLGNTQEEILNPKIQYEQQQSVIILDKSFRKIGESLLPRGKYDYTDFFVNENGLFFLQKPSLTKNEDEMTYLLFNLKVRNKS